MEKGILYIICTILILGAVVLGDSAINNKIDSKIKTQVIVEKQIVTVTPSVAVSATPSAAMKSSVVRKVTVAPVVTK